MRTIAVEDPEGVLGIRESTWTRIETDPKVEIIKAERKVHVSDADAVAWLERREVQ